MQKSLLPHEIEARSFAILTQELGDRELDPFQAPIIKRVIHTSADFDYADTLTFSQDAVPKALSALQHGACIVTDTNMVKAGINQTLLQSLGGQVYCFMADPDIAQAAKENGTTRAVASMDKAAQLQGPFIFAIGNAPTALLHLCDLMDAGKLHPELVIGVPVGFVNVIEAKERLLTYDIPYIVARGRKGGSNIAAAICNALLYQLRDRTL